MVEAAGDERRAAVLLPDRGVEVLAVHLVATDVHQAKPWPTNSSKACWYWALSSPWRANEGPVDAQMAA